MTAKIECGPGFARAFKDAIHDLGVRATGTNDGGWPVYNMDEVSLAIEQAGGPEGFLKHMAYHYIRHARGLDVLEDLATEVRELARIAAMPTKLVRDSTGRSVGAKKVPGLGKPR